MSKDLRSGAFWCMAAYLVLLLSACGGGGDGGSITLVDPAPAYAGKKTAAIITTANAEDLAVRAYTGGRLGSYIGMPKAAGEGAVGIAARDSLPVQQVAEVINSSLRRMQIPQLARKRGGRAAGTNKSAAKVETFEVAGDQGGSATFALDINQTDGTFLGTVVYAGFTSDGLALTGKTDVMGTFDASFQGFTRLTLSFRELVVDLGTMDVTLVGSLSWGYNPAASSDTLTINMVLVEPDGDTYWFNDYEQVNVYGGGSLTQTASGRFYDSDNGYVDFSTPAALVVYYGNPWPSQGEMRFSGSQGAWVGLGFHSRSYTLEADVDNNGSTDWQADYPTDNTAGPNSTPVAAAGADRAVTQWSTVTLDGSASYDPDGDPLTYYWSVDSCPAGTYPVLAGSGTATPSFVPELPGSYVLHLNVYDGRYANSTDTVTVTVSAVEPSQPGLLQQQWQYGIFGTSIGQAGLLTTDLNGDGTPEVIASASGGVFGGNSFWYVLQRTPSGEYQQLWRSKNYAVGVARIVLADVTGDGKDDILVASAGDIEVYSGANLQAVQTIPTTHTISALAVADLEGDGSQEIVTSDGTGVYAYSAQRGALEWSLASGGGSSLALGNVDADPALEIVTTTFGGKGYVIDGVSRAVEWEYLNGFGSKVALGELDGDGMQEIVGASSWYKITVFGADRKTPVWEITTTQDIGSLLVADADGDAVPEIVYGDGQSGKVVAIDVVTRLQKWAVNSLDSGVSGIALADLDLDGSKELVWGAGGNSTGPDHIYIASPVTGAVKWKSVHIDGPLSATAVGDVDDDGEDEILMVSYESDGGYGEGVIHIFNARTHALEFSEKLGFQDWMGVRSVEMGDVDGDGKTEFVVTTGNIYDGVIRVYNGATHALKKESAAYYGNFFSAIAIGDVDGDGRVEIVAGQGREHTGASGSYLLVLDGATLQEKWRSVDTGASWTGIYDLKLSDLDGDGRQDIIASSGNTLIVYDGTSHDLKLLVQHASRAMEVADIDADGTSELLVGRTDGRIDVFDGKSFTLKKSVGTFSTVPVDALRLADLDADGNTEWLLASGGVLTVLDAAGGLKWRSGDLSASLGLYNHIGVKDCDGDGRKEIYVGSLLALYQFE